LPFPFCCCCFPFFFVFVSYFLWSFPSADKSTPPHWLISLRRYTHTLDSEWKRIIARPRPV
jgi:hypothetical protein